MATSVEIAELALPYKERKFYDVVLASGTVTIKTSFGKIHHTNITQKAAAALDEAFSWTASGGDLTIDSFNGASVAVLSLEVVGQIGA